MTHPVVAAARELIGKPFRHRGRGPTHYDCAGVCLYSVQRACGGPLFDVRHYGRNPFADGLRATLVANLGDPVLADPLTEDPMPGDIALIRYEPTAEPRHVAVIGNHPLGGLSLIHTYSGAALPGVPAGRVAEHILDAHWRACIVEVFRCS